MKKIGIITIVDNTNYGNRLQNYASTRILEKLGYEVETLEFLKTNKLTKILVQLKCKLKKTFVFTVYKYVHAIISVEDKRFLSFYDFSKKYIKTRTVVYCSDKELEKLGREYDYIAIGSDQVWNYEFTVSGRKVDFAFFARPEQKICIAPSFGVSYVDELHNEMYREWLSDFIHIAVREQAGVEIVKQLTGKEASLIIDPTLVLKADDWRLVSSTPKCIMGKAYCLLYFLGEIGKEQSEYINKIVSERNLSVVNIMDRNSWAYTSSPEEFVGLIENATIVLTDSFHASVFSIIFSTPFVVFDRISIESSMSSRIDTLLNMFHAETRKYRNQDVEEAFQILSHDYVDEVLEKERKKFFDYIGEFIVC